MRDEPLDETLFFSLEHTRGKVTNRVADYNNSRPHSAIETPAAHAAHCSIGSTSAKLKRRHRLQLDECRGSQHRSRARRQRFSWFKTPLSLVLLPHYNPELNPV